jgi:hypothetical protein
MHKGARRARSWKESFNVEKMKRSGSRNSREKNETKGTTKAA